ncbi:hypothetical protein R3W88_004411 [Solanum pinnatisectum]|uniref:Glycerophosphodiester phosphodiesterase n=1 Tax=Solanum pinnatisectum TaxID=50273 RepID=A0AAV9K972_9SOLN|nr:hypothetical protein R3W88_004411 [Solanum pinnatisectum]
MSLQELSINEPSEAPRRQYTTPPQSSTQKRVQHIQGVVRKRTEIKSKLVQPSSTQAPASRVFLVITPRALDRPKASGERTILEERRLSIDGVVTDYPTIWDTIQFHKFKGFTKPRNPYIPSWVREFYTAYDQALPKKRKGTIWK